MARINTTVQFSQPLAVSKRLLENPEKELERVLDKYPIIKDEKSPDTPKYNYGVFEIEPSEEE